MKWRLMGYRASFSKMMLSSCDRYRLPEDEDVLGHDVRVEVAWVRRLNRNAGSLPP